MLSDFVSLIEMIFCHVAQPIKDDLSMYALSHLVQLNVVAQLLFRITGTIRHNYHMFMLTKRDFCFFFIVNAIELSGNKFMYSHRTVSHKVAFILATHLYFSSNHCCILAGILAIL